MGEPRTLYAKAKLEILKRAPLPLAA